MTGDTTNTLTRRTILCGGAALLATPLAVAFATGAAAQSRAAAPLTIGVLRAPAAGIIEIGENKSWFKEANVALETVLFAAAAGPKIIQALGGGSIDLSFVNSTAALLALAQGAVPLRLISIPTDPSRLFALIAGPGIENVQQLKGKRVAATEGTALHYFLARVLAKNGMSLSDIDFVNLPAADGQSAFVARRVDAIVPSVNGRFYLMNTDKEAREIFTHADFTKGQNSGETFINYDLFVTTETALETKREALRRFLSAYHGKAVPYLQSSETRKQALADITQYVNTEQKNPTDGGIMTQIIDNSEFYDLPTVKKVMTASTFRDSLEYQVKFFRDLGRIKSTPDLNKAIVTDLV